MNHKTLQRNPAASSMDESGQIHFIQHETPEQQSSKGEDLLRAPNGSNIFTAGRDKSGWQD